MSKRLANVLLVDDCYEDIVLFRNCLEKNNIQVNFLFCRDGIEALQFLQAAFHEHGFLLGKQTKPDVIFLDINMPALDGKALLRIINTTVTTVLSRRVIIYSGSECQQEQAELLALGACQYMIKPVNVQKLKACLAAMPHLQWVQEEENNRVYHVTHPSPMLVSE